MENSTLRMRYAQYLETLPLGTLRIVGREKGVPHSSARKKDDLIEAIVDVLTGVVLPVPLSNKGAPVKANYLSPEIDRRLEEIRREQPQIMLEVRSDEEEEIGYNQKIYAGILELCEDEGGYLRPQDFSSMQAEIFVPQNKISEFGLREGDLVACVTEKNAEKILTLRRVTAVNGQMAIRFSDRVAFEKLTPCYPTEKYELSQNSDSVNLRAIDLFAPVGKGQRVLLYSTMSEGRLKLLADVARSINENYEDSHTMLILFDVLPEDVSEIRKNSKRVKIVAPSIDAEEEEQVRTVMLALAHAKRIAENGRNVVVLFDSLTRFAYASERVAERTGRSSEVKRLFASARSTEEAGNLTMIATLFYGTGIARDERIAETLFGTESGKIVLNPNDCLQFEQSGTKRAERLLSQEELACVNTLRNCGYITDNGKMIQLFYKTGSNKELVSHVEELIK